MTVLTKQEVTSLEFEKIQQLSNLLVEDNMLNAKLVSILFEQHKLKIFLAENGMEAIEKLKKLISTSHEWI